MREAIGPDIKLLVDANNAYRYWFEEPVSPDDLQGAAEVAAQIEQATGVSIHFTTLQKYVTGQRLPSFDNLAAIAAYAGETLGRFLGEYDEDEKDTGVDGTASKPGAGANKEDRKIRELRAEFIARKFIALAEEMRIRMEDLGKLFDVFSELCRRISGLPKNK